MVAQLLDGQNRQNHELAELERDGQARTGSRVGQATCSSGKTGSPPAPDLSSLFAYAV